MIALLLVGVGFVLGYAARRVRPLALIDDWAWEQDYVRARDLRDDPARRRRPGWWLAQVVFAVEIAGIFAVHPRRTARQWRHRHDPPHKSPPVIVISTTDQEGTAR
ncbi:hypothetical protein [Streptomyces ardesiacus]|uniref:hypothetical protein n=1 Tax=Streptomyces ardesiacus TaxID=285564 RepID=UPI003633B4AA